MEEKQAARTDSKDAVTPRERRFVAVWASGLLLLYGVGGVLGARLLRRYAAETEAVREARIASPTVGRVDREANSNAPSGAKPVDVRIGVSLIRVGEIALKESAWTADFNLWFAWRGDRVKPGEQFRIVNGQVQLREKEKSRTLNGEKYEQYHVVARMTKQFDASRFPFGDEGLVVLVEDATHDVETLRYVADERNSDLNSVIMPQGTRRTRSLMTVKTRSQVSGQARSGRGGENVDVHSQFAFGLLISPLGLGLHIKLFQALFASVAIALLAFFIKPDFVDCRFGLPVGGFFASVANNVYVASALPAANRLTLADMVNTVSLVTLFLILAQSVASLYLLDSLGRERLCRLFDRVTFVVLLAGYVAVNLALPLAARPV